jgi:hypothetical protein
VGRRQALLPHPRERPACANARREPGRLENHAFGHRQVDDEHAPRVEPASHRLGHGMRIWKVLVDVVEADPVEGRAGRQRVGEKAFDHRRADAARTGGDLMVRLQARHAVASGGGGLQEPAVRRAHVEQCGRGRQVRRSRVKQAREIGDPQSPKRPLAAGLIQPVLPRAVDLDREGAAVEAAWATAEGPRQGVRPHGPAAEKAVQRRIGERRHTGHVRR